MIILKIILDVIELITVFVTLFLVDRCGRRFLLLLSFTVMVIDHIGNGISFHTKFNKIQLTGFEWIPLACICIFFIRYCLGIGSVSFILLVELFSISAKKIILRAEKKSSG